MRVERFLSLAENPFEVLEAQDIDGGYILACQAVPLTSEVRITY